MEEKNIWERLATNASLVEVGLPVVNGRLRLSKLRIPDTRVVKLVRTPLGDLQNIRGRPFVRNASWKDLHFSSSTLSGVALSEGTVTNCVFDKCTMRNFKIFGSTFENVLFESSDLQGAVLGGVHERRRNSFKNVIFRSTNLRGAVFQEAGFLDCSFLNCRLDRVDFQSSTFENCVFEGELRDVLFYSRAFRKGPFPDNEMKAVDFSRASLRWTEFRKLDLKEVIFPEGSDHLIVPNFPAALDRLIEVFSVRSDSDSKCMVAVLGNYRKWAGGPNSFGILHKADLVETGGEEVVRVVLDVLQGPPHG